MTIETLDQFRTRILEGVVADIDDLPKGMSAAWFNNPATNQPTIFQVKEVAPFDKYSRVVAIFQGDHTVRIYTMASAPPDPKPADWPPREPTRYTLSRTAPTYVAEVMTLEAMADAIIDEWNLVAGPETPDDELEAVIEYIAGLDVLVERDKLLTALREGDHHDDGEAAPEEPAPVSAAATALNQPS